MSNNIRTRNGMPYNFVNGLKVRGMDIESLIPGIEGIPEAGSKYQFAGDGTNNIFTLPVSPYNKDAVDVYVKQLYVHPDDYTLAGDTITLMEAPPAVVAGETYNVVVKVSLTTLNGYVDANRVSFEGENLDDILEKSKPIGNYSNLRAYAGAATQIRITDPGIEGFFYYDASDATSTDNSGTIIVATNGKRWKRHYSGAVNVKWFGADPTGVLDSTEAFNLTTRADYSGGGLFDQNFPGGVFVPAGLYKILGTIYIHKGQHLFGAGQGSSKIDCSGMSSYSGPVFKLGYSLSEQDAGGLPPEISEIWTYGGPASHSVVDMSVAGASAHHMFITSPGIGIRVSGGDTIVSDCTIDQGLSAIVASGQNHIVDSCIFYNMNYGVSVLNNTFDVQINNCHFEYGIYNDVLFAETAGNIKNVSVQNCQFIKNEQYVTSNCSIHIRSNGADVFVHGCEFRNQRGYSIEIPTGIGNNLRVSNCVFDGNKTNPGYVQSSTAAGVRVQNGYVEITNCRFENLYGSPVAVNSTLDYWTVIKSCSYRNISIATSFVNITATTGALTITECVGDGVLPLINLQSNIRPRMKNNVRWLGAAGNSGGRFFWKIPITGSSTLQVGIIANTNPSGNLLYRKCTTLFVSRHIDYNGSAVADYATKSTTNESPANFAPAINTQVELDAVGGGASGVYSAQGRYLVVSIPNTYYYSEVEADFVV